MAWGAIAAAVVGLVGQWALSEFAGGGGGGGEPATQVTQSEDKITPVTVKLANGQIVTMGYKSGSSQTTTRSGGPSEPDPMVSAASRLIGDATSTYIAQNLKKSKGVDGGDTAGSSGGTNYGQGSMDSGPADLPTGTSANPSVSAATRDPGADVVEKWRRDYFKGRGLA